MIITAFKRQLLFFVLLLAFCISWSFDARAQSSARKKLNWVIGMEGNNFGYGLQVFSHANRSLSFGVTTHTFSSSGENISKSSSGYFGDIYIFPMDSSNLYIDIGLGNVDKSWELDYCSIITSGTCKGTVEWPILAYNAGIGAHWVDTRSGATGGVSLKYYQFGSPTFKFDNDAFANNIETLIKDEMDRSSSGVTISVNVGVSF